MQKEPLKFASLSFKAGGFKWVTEDVMSFPLAYDQRKPNRKYIGSVDVRLEIKACEGGYRIDLVLKYGTPLVRGHLVSSYGDALLELRQRKLHYLQVGVDLPTDEKVERPQPKAEKSFWAKVGSLLARGKGQSCA